MAIDSRFSKQQFLFELENRKGTSDLPDQLAAEVLGLLHEAVQSRFNEIVEQVNQLGHHLRAYSEPQPGEIAFRDDRESNGEYVCDLRLAVDVVVSVGFRDTIDYVPEDD
jgi:hypothetical protein